MQQSPGRASLREVGHMPVLSEPLPSSAQRQRLVVPAKGEERVPSSKSSVTSLGSSEANTTFCSEGSAGIDGWQASGAEDLPLARARSDGEFDQQASPGGLMVRVQSEGTREAFAQRRRPVHGFLHQHLSMLEPLAHHSESRRKDPSTQRWLDDIVSQATLAFAPAARAAIVQACHLRHVAEGEVLAREGEHVARHMPGLCILEQGVVRVHQAVAGSSSSEGFGPVIKTYGRRGDVVEEMSSVHGAGRPSTVVAQEAASVWCANRDVLVRAQVRSAKESRSFLLQSLDKVELFSPLDLEARARLVDSLTEVSFNAGETLIAEGVEEDACYILVQGRAATKRGRCLLHELRPGQTFNELALIHQMVRASSVVAVTDMVCAVIQRETFSRVIGSQEELRQHACTLYLSVAGTKGRRVSNESAKLSICAKGSSPQSR